MVVDDSSCNGSGALRQAVGWRSGGCKAEASGGLTLSFALLSGDYSGSSVSVSCGGSL